MSHIRVRKAISGLSAAVLLAGLAHASLAQAAAPKPAASDDTPADPFEATNRRVYGFDRALDRTALRPLALDYARIVPSPVRSALRNGFSNLGEPLVAVNDLLQLRIGVAARTLVRFAVNSTFGAAGVFDVGARGGLPHHANDFGLTLARAGVGPGPYLVLPVLGPSNVRDAIGMGFDAAANPFTWINYPHHTEIGIGGGVLTGLDARAQADRDLVAVDAMATDAYATLRSLYLQNRQGEISGGTVDVNALPDFDTPSNLSPPASAAPSTARPPTS